MTEVAFSQLEEQRPAINGRAATNQLFVYEQTDSDWLASKCFITSFNGLNRKSNNMASIEAIKNSELRC